MGQLQDSPLPEMVVDSIEISHEPRDTDDDLARALNLLFDLPNPDYAYPHYYFKNTAGMRKPKVLTIGDSYWWNVFGRGLTVQAFNGSSFWYYNQKAYYDDNRPEIPVDSLNIQQEVEKYDFVIVIGTEGTLHNFPYNFVEQLYDFYSGKADEIRQKHEYEKEVKYHETLIRNIPEWFENVRKKAGKTGKK